MKASHLLLKRVLPSLILFSGVALATQGQARAAATVDCGETALKGYLNQTRLPRQLTNYPAILIGQQNFYSCRVQKFYADSVQAVFLARTGQRIAKLSQDVMNPVNSCSSISQAVTATLNDIGSLEKVDSSAELGAFKADLKSLADKSCASWAMTIMSDDKSLDKSNKDLCAYLKVIETQRTGSTLGFSRMIADCPSH